MEYGLVLAGGGARGAYHVGAWKAIRELGIEISAVSGTSIGAVNGALFAQGYYDGAYEMWKRITLENIVTLPDGLENTDNLFDLKNIPALIRHIREKEGLDMKPLEKILRQVIDEKKIRGSGISLGFTAYSLSDREEKQFFIDDIPKGKLTEYLMAGICLPGFKAGIIDGKKVIDGGVADNMPVDMLLERGMKNIIAVDVQGIGFYKSFNAAGVNIIDIKNESPSVGTLDFDSRGIEEDISSGYFDAKKAFGYLAGDIYSFEINEYINARHGMSQSILTGLETAAHAFGADRFKVYSVEELAKETMARFKEYSQNNSVMDEPKPKAPARAIITFILNRLCNPRGDFLKSALSVFKDYYEAANSILYFMALSNTDIF